LLGFGECLVGFGLVHLLLKAATQILSQVARSMLGQVDSLGLKELIGLGLNHRHLFPQLNLATVKAK
jgi:hypothetical protein